MASARLTTSARNSHGRCILDKTILMGTEFEIFCWLAVDTAMQQRYNPFDAIGQC